MKAICALYEQAPQLAQEGESTVSTDEMTGVQALERKRPGLPLAAGLVERREFEYIRHGTRSFILSRDVVTGKILAPCLWTHAHGGRFLGACASRGRHQPRGHPLAYRLRLSQHPSIGIVGALGGPSFGDRS